jgi:hypothetical protein
MNQKLSSLLWDIILLAGFIYVLLVMHKVVKPPVPIKTIERPTPFIRVLVYLGVLLFAILLVLDIMGK